MMQDIAVVTRTENDYVRWCAEHALQAYRGRVRRIRRPFDLLGMPEGTRYVELGRPVWWVVSDHEELDMRKEAFRAHPAEEADAG